jgi:hypothetical protein
MARASRRGGQVALVDGADALDPASAVAAGVDLSRLLWVRCGGRLATALAVADLLARSPGFALVGVDLGELRLLSSQAIPARTCFRLQRAVEGSATVLVLRTPYRLAGSAARLVLTMHRLKAEWAGGSRPTRLVGLSVEARSMRSGAGSASIVTWQA